MSVARDLGQVLDALLEGIVLLDAKGRVERLNAEACRILETSSEAVAGCPVEEIPGGDVLARLARAVGERESATVENEQRIAGRLAGETTVDVAASPLVDAGGRIDGTVLVLHDRTIGDTLRELWSERARLEAFGRIAAGIAHEVKNPLGGIRGAAELLGRRVSDSKGRETAGLIVREVDRIATLIDEFMVFARGEALRLVPVNLLRVLDDVLALVAMDPLGARAKVERRFDPSIPEFWADSDRLTQVFLNLARNALEAMEPAGGTLIITTRLSLEGRLDAGAGERAPTVVIDVEDTGCGIPAELLDRVATPFFTTKPRGSGLGLALARHFVSLHGGTVQIQSRPDHGTTVRVALPLRRAP